MAFQVVVFTSKDDRNLGYERSKAFAELLSEHKIPTRVIHKLGFDEEDLLFTARHKIVTTPSVLVFSGDRVIFRQTSLPTLETIKKLCR